MKKINKYFFAMMIAVFLFSVFTLPSASAAGATSVWVNNVELNAGNPYWKNGNLPASASDCNAHFDAATSTLTLNSAVINTPHAASGSQNLVSANGDLNLVLTGTSTLQYTANALGYYNGFHVNGLLTITGSGGANILLNSNDYNIYLYGNLSDTLAIESGTLDVQIGGVYNASGASGIASYKDISISGGNVTIGCKGIQCYMVFAMSGDFSMTGGNITATTVSTNSMGVAAQNITLEGGEGVFSGSASGPGTGGYLAGTALSVSGGHFVFSGNNEALFSQNGPPTVSLTNVLTYVSTDVSGSGKSLWTSPADGVLISTYTVPSPFLYVEFILPGSGDKYPLTGDSQMPWLWAEIVLLCLLSVAGLAATMARKRRA